MKAIVHMLVAAAILSGPALIHAEDMTRGSSGGVITSLEKIKNKLSHHEKMVEKIKSYLKERESVPSTARAESDDKFLMSIKGDKDKKKEGAKGKKDVKKKRKPAEPMNPYSN